MDNLFAQSIESLRKDNNNFKNLPLEIRSNPEFIKEAIAIPSMVIQLKHMGKDLKDNKQFIGQLMQVNSLCFLYSSARLQQDKELILQFILYDNKDNYNLMFLDEHYQKRFHSKQQFADDMRKEIFNDELLATLEEKPSMTKRKI